MNFVKFSENAKQPSKGDSESAGYDLYASNDTFVPAWNRAIVKTDIGFEIPVGFYGRIASRSGLGSKGYDIGAGVIDSSYRGEIKIVFINSTSSDYTIKKGDKIAQIIFEKHYSFDFKQVETLSASTRGTDGFGSTDKQ